MRGGNVTEIFGILLKLNHIAGMWLVSKCKKLLAVALASNNIPPNNNNKKKNAPCATHDPFARLL